MGYGLSLKRARDNSLTNQNLIFYPTTRGGISTSDTYYFELINFQADDMKVSFDQFGNLLGSAVSPLSSSISLDLNRYYFYGQCVNTTKPTVVEICSIDAYEIGVANTTFGSWDIGSKVIQNYSRPAYIFDVINKSPYGVQTSTFTLSLNQTVLADDVFAYVKFSNKNIIKYFLATPSGTWLELPDEKFFYNVDYYITTSSFNGTTISQSVFNGIYLSTGETILINNVAANDILSGVYVIKAISNYVYLTKSDIVYNYPGQIFTAGANLDTSNSLNKNGACYFVTYLYGTPAKCFTKALKLMNYIAEASITDDMFYLQKDIYTKSSLLLSLNKISPFVKQSDVFALGVLSPTWCLDSTLFGVTLNIEIDEGE